MMGSASTPASVWLTELQITPRGRDGGRKGGNGERMEEIGRWRGDREGRREKGG